LTYQKSLKWSTAAILALATIAILCGSSAAFELANWRLPYCLLSQDLDAVRSSPSGMFWDDLALDSAFGPGLQANASRITADNWHFEPALGGGWSNGKYADSLSHFYLVKIGDEARFHNLFMRTVLDVDSRFLRDPTYPWKQDRISAGRFEEAYLQANWSFGFFRLGRLNRNWGPFLDRSLLVSDNPYSYDVAELALHGSFFEFRDMFAAFPYARSGADADMITRLNSRYLSAHSLNFMIGRLGTVGVSEAVLFTRNVGMPDLQYFNPFSVYTVINTNSEADANLMIALQWDIHPLVNNVSIKGQVLLDDFQVDNSGPQDQEPTDWGGDFEVSCHDVLPIGLRHSVALNYRYCSRWLYTVADGNLITGQRYTYLGRSLGQPQNDADGWDLTFSLIGKRFWAGNAGIQVARHGQTTLFTKWNDTSDPLKTPGALGYRNEPAFPSGIVETTIDPYVRALGFYSGYADLGLELHNRWVRNRNNIVHSDFVYDPLVSVVLNLHYPNFCWLFPAGKSR
jgi:hypothetical protein